MQAASKANNYHYNKSLQKRALVNRKSMTKSAACMWKYLLGGKQLLGYQFRREQPILNFIVDFVSFDLMLVVEVDGATHDNKEAVIKDARRDEVLKSIGFTVLIFGSWEVLNRMVEVDIKLYNWVKENSKIPPPGPRQRGKLTKKPNTSKLHWAFTFL